MKKEYTFIVVFIASIFTVNGQSINRLEKAYGFKDILFCMAKVGINYKINECVDVKDEKVSLCTFKHPSYNSYGGIAVDNASVMIAGQLVRGFKLTMVNKGANGEDERSKKMLTRLKTLYGEPTNISNENIFEWEGNQVGIRYYLKKDASGNGNTTSVLYLYHVSYKKYFTNMP